MKEEVFEIILNSSDELGEEYLEMGLDSFLDDGIIKEVPIVSTVYSILKIGINISQVFFLKKLTNFIVHISDFSLEERKEFVKKYKKDDKDFAEKLIVVLDRLDETDKCYYLSKIFKSYAYDKIDYTLFRFFCKSLEVLSIDDIIYIKNSIKTEKYCDDIHGVKFLNAGLANIMMFPGRAGYSISETGVNFYNCLFDDDYIYDEK